jgi:hypothetical protein
MRGFMTVVVNGLWIGWIKINGKIKYFYRGQDSQQLLDASNEPNQNLKQLAA